MKFPLIILAGALFLMLCPSVSVAQQIAVIVNKSNEITSIDLSDLSNIYKGRKTDWESNGEIVVVNRGPESDLRKKFYSVVLNSRPSQRFFVPGSPVPVRHLIQKSDQALMKYIAAEKRAIGYLFLKDLDQSEKGIKVIKVID